MQVARGEHKALGGGAGGGEGGQREGEGGNNHHTQAVVCGGWGCGVEEGNGRGGGGLSSQFVFSPPIGSFPVSERFCRKSGGVSQTDV